MLFSSQLYINKTGLKVCYITIKTILKREDYMKLLMYKNIVGVVEDEKIEEEYCGKLLIEGVACFYGSTKKELIEDFKQMVNDYLEFCKIDNKEPDLVEIIK